MANFCSIFYFQTQHLKCCQNALEVSNLVKTCLLTPVLTWESLSFKFQTHNSNLLEQHFWTIFNMENCSIFVVFSDSPDASEKIDFMSFLWSARLVEIYSKTSFVKNVPFLTLFSVPYSSEVATKTSKFTINFASSSENWAFFCTIIDSNKVFVVFVLLLWAPRLVKIYSKTSFDQNGGVQRSKAWKGFKK